MIKVLFICHGNIPKRLKNVRKIRGSGRLEGAYYALAYRQTVQWTVWSYTTTTPI